MSSCKLFKKVRFFGLFFLIFSAGSALGAESFELVRSFFREDQGRVAPLVQLWTRGWKGDSGLITSQLMDQVRELEGHWLFEGELPEKFSVLLDGTFTRAAAYWDDTLTAPDGSPAILLTPAAALDISRSDNLLTHEITHHLHHRYRKWEKFWVREGLALLAEKIVTSHFHPSLEEGFLAPESSLTEDMNPRTTQEPDKSIPEYQMNSKRGRTYGHLLQYFYFIYRLCGKDQLFSTLLKSQAPTSGVDFVDGTLKLMRATSPKIAGEVACSGFKESFLQFQKARFSQSPIRPNTWVTANDMKATVRKEPMVLTQPYSATAYEVAPPTGCARKEDILLNPMLCLRVRME
jgi:hypothetical protein